MFRLVFLVFSFAISLHALNDSEILDRANALMQTKDKSNNFRAYNDYKNLYVRAVMADDSKLKFSALEGIVKSGNLLHIDVATYEEEFSTLKPQKSENKPYGEAKPTTKHKEEKKVEIKSSNKLQSVKFNNETLVLEFDGELGSKQINYSTQYDTKTKQFKYILDISSAMLTKSQTLRKMGIEKITLVQFSGDALRLTIQNSSKLTVNFKNESNQLLIDMSAEGKEAKNKKENVSSSAEIASTPSRLDRNKIIVIDAGHGGTDPGAIGHKEYKEKNIVLQVAKELKSILKSRGYKVQMTRDSDVFVKLSKRTEFANQKHADLFVSIHANAVDKKGANRVNGIESYFLSTSRSDRAKKVASQENSADMSDMNFYGKESFLNTINSHNIIASNKLAIDLQRGMLSSLKKKYSDVVDSGVKEGPFWVLVGAQMPSVLVEVGFISHPIEGARLIGSDYQKRLALGMADGIESYFVNN